MNKHRKACDRIGWHQHYVERFNATLDVHAEQLACWFLFLHLAFDEPATELSP